MKRNNDILRELLLEAEADESPFFLVPYTQDTEDARNAYHAKLLCDVGLFEEVNDQVYRLTSQGHDFLAATKLEGAWEKIQSTAGHLSIEAMKVVGDKIIRQSLDDLT